jgi:alkylhydroperoxidase family enzyme
MTWTTWIATKPDTTNDEAVQQLYRRTREYATGNPPDLVRLNSLTPPVAGLLYDLQKAVYHNADGLTLREKEIAALIVSAFNGCVH